MFENMGKQKRSGLNSYKEKIDISDETGAPGKKP